MYQLNEFINLNMEFLTKEEIFQIKLVSTTKRSFHISLVENKGDVHPADMEILKYMLFLHKLASEIIEANDFSAQLRRKFDQTKYRKKMSRSRLQKEKGLINKVWLNLKEEVIEVNEEGALNNFNDFLKGIKDGLDGLQELFYYTSKISEYTNQNWFKTLKRIFVCYNDKSSMELLLHMTVFRLFSLVEESVNNGLEDDYIQYMNQNRKHCMKTLEEVMFIIEALGEYSKAVKRYDDSFKFE